MRMISATYMESILTLLCKPCLRIELMQLQEEELQELVHLMAWAMYNRRADIGKLM